MELLTVRSSKTVPLCAKENENCRQHAVTTASLITFTFIQLFLVFLFYFSSFTYSFASSLDLAAWLSCAFFRGYLKLIVIFSPKHIQPNPNRKHKSILGA